jgi:hypothetical protein
MSGDTIDFLESWTQGDMMNNQRGPLWVEPVALRELALARSCRAVQTVYRGLNFRLRDLLAKDGNPLFLRALLDWKVGGVVQFASPRISSWTTSLDTAIHFANASGPVEWAGSSGSTKRPFGLVLQMDVGRDDILYDTHFLDPELRDSLYESTWDQDELVIRPGVYNTTVKWFNDVLRNARTAQNRPAYVQLRERYGRQLAAICEASSYKGDHTLTCHNEETNAEFQFGPDLASVRTRDNSPLEPWKTRTFATPAPPHFVAWLDSNRSHLIPPID